MGAAQVRVEQSIVGSREERTLDFLNWKITRGQGRTQDFLKGGDFFSMYSGQ